MEIQTAHQFAAKIVRLVIHEQIVRLAIGTLDCIDMNTWFADPHKIE